MASNQKMSGTYIYDLVFPLIDYCGNIKSQGNTNSSGVSYSANFSPNNIKRLIVSPDVVAVHYHLAIGDGGRTRKKPISPIMLDACSNLDDYKPIVSILGTTRVCASVEEVIFLTRSADGQHSLNYKELEFSGLVQSFSRKGSLEEMVSNRYKRLHDFTIIDMSYPQFEQNLRTTQGDYDFIVDMPFMEGANVRLIHDEPDWYKSWGSSAQFYALDAVGGGLHNHFTNLVKKHEDKKRAENIKKSTGERVKGLESDLDKAFSVYDKAKKCYIQISKANSLIKPCVLFKANFVTLQPPKLYKCEYFKNKKVSAELESSSEREAIVENTKILNGFVAKIYETLCDFLFHNLADLCQSKPITAKVLLKDVETTIVVPQSSQKYTSIIENVTGVRFHGENMKAGMANVAWHCANLLISKSGDHKFQRGEESREYWVKLLKEEKVS